MLKGPLLINSIDFTLVMALVTTSFRHYIYTYIYFTYPQGFSVKYLTK